jgi:hypothetical protein
MGFSTDYRLLDLGVLLSPEATTYLQVLSQLQHYGSMVYFLASILLNSEGKSNCTLGCSLLRRKGIEGEISQDVASGIRVAGNVSGHCFRNQSSIVEVALAASMRLF